MSPPLREQTHLWQAPALGDVEMLHARYYQQRFAPHVHEGYVFTAVSYTHLTLPTIYSV